MLSVDAVLLTLIFSKMKTIFRSIYILTITSTVILSSCKKDPPKDDTDATIKYGSVKFEFENVVGDSALILNVKNYLNANGDTFNVSMFKYYISNIKLMSAGGTFTEPESYHLLDQSVTGSLKFTINNVPVGNYTGISFMIGVDSTRNVSGAQTGALSQANGMFWSWSSGYIMAKFEGYSPQSGASANNLIFHTGGFSGANSVLRTVSPSFGSATANVTESTMPEIHIVADLAEWFKIPSTINFATTHTIHSAGANAKMIADNYADMFTVEYIHN